jgi:hypothetical protein
MKKNQIIKTFDKEEMAAVANDESELLEKIEDKIIDNSRWSIQHEMIFKELATQKHYISFFNRGATEYQDEGPYEYDNKMIECVEVEPKEVLVKTWVNVEEK